MINMNLASNPERLSSDGKDYPKDRTFTKGNFRYVIKWDIDDQYDPREILGDAEQNYKGLPEDEREKYKAQDQARYDDCIAGKWGMLWVKVEIFVICHGAGSPPTIKLGQSSLYGIESDSHQSHFDECEREQIAEAEEDIDKLRVALWDDAAVLKRAADILTGTKIHSRLVAAAVACELVKGSAA